MAAAAAVYLSHYVFAFLNRCAEKMKHKIMFAMDILKSAASLLTSQAE